MSIASRACRRATPAPERSWLFSLLSLATKKQLDDDDVWALPERERAETLERRYDALIQARGKLSLSKVLKTMFWRRWVLAGAMYIGWCFCAGVQVSGPYPPVP